MMLDVHSRFTELIKSVFNGDLQFVGALDKVSTWCNYVFASGLWTNLLIVDYNCLEEH